MSITIGDGTVHAYFLDKYKAGDDIVMNVIDDKREMLVYGKVVASVFMKGIYVKLFIPSRGEVIEFIPSLALDSMVKNKQIDKAGKKPFRDDDDD